MALATGGGGGGEFADVERVGFRREDGASDGGCAGGPDLADGREAVAGQAVHGGGRVDDAVHVGKGRADQRQHVVEGRVVGGEAARGQGHGITVSSARAPFAGRPWRRGGAVGEDRVGRHAEGEDVGKAVGRVDGEAVVGFKADADGVGAAGKAGDGGAGVGIGRAGMAEVRFVPEVDAGLLRGSTGGAGGKSAAARRMTASSAAHEVSGSK